MAFRTDLEFPYYIRTVSVLSPYYIRTITARNATGVQFLDFTHFRTVSGSGQWIHFTEDARTRSPNLGLHRLPSLDLPRADPWAIGRRGSC